MAEGDDNDAPSSPRRKDDKSKRNFMGAADKTEQKQRSHNNSIKYMYIMNAPCLLHGYKVKHFA